MPYEEKFYGLEGNKLPVIHASSVVLFIIGQYIKIVF